MKTCSGFLFLILLVTGFLYTGCDGPGNCIDGNGIVQTETRITGSFTGISSESFFDVYLIQDSIEEVIVEAESNLLPYIQTVVSGSVLILREQKHYCLDNTLPVKITVRVKNLEKVALTGSGNIQGNSELETHSLEIDLTGSGNIDMEVKAQQVEAWLGGSGNIDLGVTTYDIQATITGSGDLHFWGETLDSDVTITGSGNIRAYGLVQDNCYVTITGSGSVYVFVNDYLDVKITGSGSVYYRGSPQIKASITGSGKVVPG
ncbi:MAG TPA: head GIN domain-containing protein [Bacteroidales bacterium]|nr:head GIN domain-containing protein [Bacteroidales bacterium]HRZ20468.1 head GIN domain-containing protein [Bacteroidales bacterium]